MPTLTPSTTRAPGTGVAPDQEAPTLRVSICWGRDQSDAWWAMVDVSSRVSGSAGGVVGRDSQQGDLQPRTCSIRLRSDDGLLTPGNEASSFYPWVVPGGGMIRVEVQIEGETIPLFTGRVERVTPVWQDDAFEYVDLACRSWFGDWNGAELGAEWTGGDVSTYVLPRVLELAQARGLGWTIVAPALSSGYSWGLSLLAAVPANTDRISLLEAAQEAANSDGGWLFDTAAGPVVFRNRDWPSEAPDGPVAGGTASALPISKNPTPDFPDDSIYTDVIATDREGTVIGRGTNEEAARIYGLRAITRVLALASTADAQAGADWYAFVWSDPDLGLPEFEVRGDANGTWSPLRTAAKLNVLDRITVQATSPAGVVIDQDCVIDAIEWTVEGYAAWTFRFETSPRPTIGATWVWGDGVTTGSIWDGGDRWTW